MITGRVNERYEAVIPITLMGLVNREWHHFDATIDTGLDYFLVLPRAVITQLGYSITETQIMILGDEQQHEFGQTAVGILRDGETRGIPALVSETETLAGARLLAGYFLTAATVPGGRVTITKLPTTQIYP